MTNPATVLVTVTTTREAWEASWAEVRELARWGDLEAPMLSQEEVEETLREVFQNPMNRTAWEIFTARG